MFPARVPSSKIHTAVFVKPSSVYSLRTASTAAHASAMGLVDYPSSPDSSDTNEDLNSGLRSAQSQNKDQDDDEPRPAKKRRVLPALRSANASTQASPLPALPASFRDLYSSTVRTTTHDSPALHAGRQRATPHVVGNWPTHISLECK
jgi:hypothetical protein